MTSDEITTELRDITRRLWAIADALRPVKLDGIPAPNDLGVAPEFRDTDARMLRPARRRRSDRTMRRMMFYLRRWASIIAVAVLAVFLTACVDITYTVRFPCNSDSAVAPADTIVKCSTLDSLARR